MQCFSLTYILLLLLLNVREQKITLLQMDLVKYGAVLPLMAFFYFCPTERWADQPGIFRLQLSASLTIRVNASMLHTANMVIEAGEQRANLSGAGIYPLQLSAAPCLVVSVHNKYKCKYTRYKYKLNMGSVYKSSFLDAELVLQLFWTLGTPLHAGFFINHLDFLQNKPLTAAWF